MPAIPHCGPEIVIAQALRLGNTHQGRRAAPVAYLLSCVFLEATVMGSWQPAELAEHFLASGSVGGAQNPVLHRPGPPPTPTPTLPPPHAPCGVQQQCRRRPHLVRPPPLSLHDPRGHDRRDSGVLRPLGCRAPGGEMALRLRWQANGPRLRSAQKVVAAFAPL